MASENGSIVVLLDELELVARETSRNEVDVTLEDALVSSSVGLPIFIEAENTLEDATPLLTNYVELNILLEDAETRNPRIISVSQSLEDADLLSDLDISGTRLDVQLAGAILEATLDLSGSTVVTQLEDASLESSVTVRGGMLLQTLEAFELESSIFSTVKVSVGVTLEDVSATIESDIIVSGETEKTLDDISSFASDVSLPIYADGISAFGNVKGTIRGTKIVSAETTIEFGDVISIAKGYNLTGTLSPYQQVVTWGNHPATGQSVKTRLGNLKGITGNTEFGLFASSGWNLYSEGLINDDLINNPSFSVSDGVSHIIASTRGIRTYNIDVTLFDAGTPVVKLDHEVPSFALGNPISDSFLGSGANIGIWMGLDAGAYKFRVGSPNDNEESIRWTGTSLEIRGASFTQFKGTSEVIKLDPTSPSLAIGNPAPSSFGVGTGLWTGIDTDGQYKFRLGTPGLARLEWESGELNLFGTTLQFEGDEGSIVLTKSSLEKISSTSFSGSGIYIDSEGIFGVHASTIQAYMSAVTGELVAADSIFLNSQGIKMLGGQFTVGQATSFTAGTGVWIGELPTDLLVTYETGDYIYTEGATLTWDGDEQRLALGGGFGFRIGDPAGDRLEWDGQSLNLFAPVINLIESNAVGNPYLYFKEIGGSPLLTMSAQDTVSAVIGEILVSTFNALPTELLITADTIDFSSVPYVPADPTEALQLATKQYVDNSGVTDHGVLTGLADDDHPQYTRVDTGFGFTTPALLHIPFGGKAPYETNFDVNTFGHLGQIATVSGGVIGRPGKFGKAVQVAEATTNLVTNPSFETNTTGWSGIDTSASGEGRTTVESKYGEYSYYGLIDSSIFGGLQYTTAIAISSSTDYTVSAWVKCSVSGAYMRIRVLTDVAGNFDFNFTSSTDWQLVTGTFTSGVSDTQITNISIQKVNVSTTLDLYVDAVQIEEKSYPTPYCDGSLGAGHSWSGTEHASTSSRVAANLSYPTAGNIDLAEGSISMWWIPSYSSDDAFATSYLFTDGTFRAYLLNTTKQYYFRNATDFVKTVDAQSFSSQDKIHLTFTWEPSGLKIYVNGVLAGEAVGYTPPSPGTDFNIGSDLTDGHSNAFIDDFAIFDRVLTASEIKAVYESGNPLVVPNETLDRRELIYLKAFYYDEDVEIMNGAVYFTVPAYLSGAIVQSVDSKVYTGSATAILYNVTKAETIVAGKLLNTGDVLRVDVSAATGALGLDYWCEVLL